MNRLSSARVKATVALVALGRPVTSLGKTTGSAVMNSIQAELSCISQGDRVHDVKLPSGAKIKKIKNTIIKNGANFVACCRAWYLAVGAWCQTGFSWVWSSANLE